MEVERVEWGTHNMSSWQEENRTRGGDQFEDYRIRMVMHAVQKLVLAILCINSSSRFSSLMVGNI